MSEAMIEQHPLHCVAQCVDGVALLREPGKQAGKALRIRERGRHRIQGPEEVAAVQVRTAAEHAPQLRAEAEQPAIEKPRREHRIAFEVVQAGFEDPDLFWRHAVIDSMQGGEIWRAARCSAVLKRAVEDRLQATA
jgi:hypothetical protein